MRNNNSIVEIQNYQMHNNNNIEEIQNYQMRNNNSIEEIRLQEGGNMYTVHTIQKQKQVNKLPQISREDSERKVAVKKCYTVQYNMLCINKGADTEPTFSVA